ncbi:hypothetical protein NC652_002984 [Populus alba x Populus x berolinensis]|nr:hypothetical protein NC652_002984 [Populus alba x Populus x berolinensis]
MSCNPLATSLRKLPATVPKGNLWRVNLYGSSSPVKAAKLKLQTISLHGRGTEEHPPTIIITSRYLLLYHSIIITSNLNSGEQVQVAIRPEQSK